MDLYEALKSGTSAEELLQTFNKELDAAKDRVAAEEKEAKEAAAKKQEQEEYVADCRVVLADAIVNYADAICDMQEAGSTDLKFEDVEEALIQFEKSLEKANASLNVWDELWDALDKAPLVLHTDTDDDFFNLMYWKRD